jgi:quinoprotein glucose dehydrogenase
VSDASTPPPVAVAAFQALDRLDDPGLAELTRQTLKAGSPELRVEALRMLTRTAPGEAVQVLERTMQSDSVPELQGALQALGRLSREPAADTVLSRALDRLIAGEVPPEVQLDLLEAADRRRSPEIRAKLKRYEESRPADDPLAAYRESMHGGDPVKGRNLFMQKAEVSCLRCHKVEDGGGEVGPDLNGIGKRVDRRYLLEAIVAPNARIAEGFESLVVATDDGRIEVGILKEETDDRVRLMSAEGKLIEIPKASIEDRKRGDSAMPSDLVKSLSKSELRDLIAYLAGVDVGTDPRGGLGHPAGGRDRVPSRLAPEIASS